jgi:hypothetical protein
MNLIGHYKNWAIKEHMYPTIYLVFTSNNTFKNEIILPSYRDYYKRINLRNSQDYFFINDAIYNAYSILQVLTKYIPRVYSIDSGYIEPSVIPLYLSQLKPADWNIIVSRDEYDLQYSYLDKWSYISPKGDNSSFINKGNLWVYIKNREKIDINFYFHPEVFLWAKCILGDKYRGIPKLTRTGWKTVIQYLQEVSDPNDVSESALMIQLHKLAEYIEKKKIQDTVFNDNMYCTSVQKQCNALLDTDKAMIINQLTDMEDITSLQKINYTIFREFPLNLNFLLREVPLEGSVPHDKYNWR